MRTRPRRVALALALLGATLILIGRGPERSAELFRPFACPVPVEVEGWLRCDGGPAGLGLAPGDLWVEGRRGRMDPAALAALRIPLDLNHSTARDLTSLPGVGPAIAARIVEGRPYRSVEDLERVKGIGPRRLAAIEGRLRVAPVSSSGLIE